MKLITPLVAVLAALAVACGNGDDNGGNSQDAAASIVIPAEDADRVAHAGLPTMEDLPGENWQVVSEDDFGEPEGDGFLEFIEGTPECATLENLATLEGVFGAEVEGDDEVTGRAQVEFEQQNPDLLIPPSIEAEIEIDESTAGSRAEFTIVKELFQSDETSNCLITVLNNQFAETGPSGVQIEVSEGTGSAEAPQDGVRMAFDIDMAVAGLELEMAMQMYFWPYGNANVQVMFVGTNEALTEELIQTVLNAVDENLQAAAVE